MNRLGLGWRIRLLGVAGCLIAALPQLTAQAQLDLDRLYSLPRLIGTAPRAPVWSPDSRRLLFLWNEEGTNFLDLWLAEAASGEIQRLTHLRPKSSGLGESAEEARRRDQLERDNGLAGAFWHPDGERVLFLRSRRLFLLPPGQLPLKLADGISQPKFSPDGRFIAFVRDGALRLVETGGLEEFHERTLIRPESQTDVLERFEWSSDSALLAVVLRDASRVPRRLVPDYLTEETTVTEVTRPYPGEETVSRRLGIIRVSDPGSPRWIGWSDDVREPIWEIAWEPAGSRLLIETSDFLVKHRRILVADAVSGKTEVVFQEQDSQNVSPAWSSGWSSDGEVLLLSDRDGYYHLYGLDLRSAQLRQLTSGAWEVDRLSGERANRQLLVTANRGRPEERHLLQVDPKGGAVALTSIPGTHDISISPDGRWAADIFSSDQRPPDLYLIPLDEPGNLRRLTTSPRPDFANYRWVAPRYVTFPSHVDGAILYGRLLVPPDLEPGRKYPAILGSVYSDTVRNQWGGRNAHPTWGLDQYLVQQGFILLNVDIRGSWGHGRDYRRKLLQDYGGIDVEDLYSGVQYLKSLGSVDEGRIGIWGSSYGGLLTCMSLFRKPGVYAAGVAGAPATNVRHAFPEQMWVMLEPDRYPDKFDRSSARSHAAGLEDPLLIIHGMRDSVVFFQDSLNLVNDLVSLGKDVDLVVLPDGGHGWDNEGLAQTRFAFRKLVEFFSRHLGVNLAPPN